MRGSLALKAETLVIASNKTDTDGLSQDGLSKSDLAEQQAKTRTLAQAASN